MLSGGGQLWGSQSAVLRMSDIPKDAREVYCNEKGEPIAFCPKESIGLTDLKRAEFYSLNKDRLQEMLERVKTVKGPDFCVICIDVDDPTWKLLVDLLMPDHDWEAYRTKGETPVARGIVPREIVQDAAEAFYQAALPLPEGQFISIFAAQGISII